MITSGPRVQAPAEAEKGAVIQVKALIGHTMETGLRYDDKGSIIPRKIINRFVCRYGDAVVFSADFHESVASNPYIEFYLRATESGVLALVWEEDGGSVFRLEHRLQVNS